VGGVLAHQQIAPVYGRLAPKSASTRKDFAGRVDLWRQCPAGTGTGAHDGSLGKQMPGASLRQKRHCLKLPAWAASRIGRGLCETLSAILP